MSGLNAGALFLAASLAAVLGALHLLDGHLRYGMAGERRAAGARWAKRRDLRDLVVDPPVPGRVVLGRHGRRLLATENQASVLVVGPTRISHKTSGLTIPAVLEWQGPAVVTSVKSDLLRATLKRRSAMGEAMIFDPLGFTRKANVKATPLSACGTWGGAMRTAHLLSESARTGGDGLSDSQFWHSAAEKLLSPMLFAAAGGRKSMKDVIRWLNAGPGARAQVEELLKASKCEDAMSAWQANWNREERQRSSVYTTAETILQAFSDPRVLAATSRAEYTPAKLLDGEANTLYLCGPAHEQKRLRSLFAAMLAEITALVQERSAATGKPIDPPLLLALDEAANTAPMPDLDVVASSGAGQGIQLVTAVQDLAQVEDRYGKTRAETIFNNHHATIVAAGISDPATLAYIDGAVGSGEFTQRSRTTAVRGQGSSTEASAYRSLAAANVVREAKPGTAHLLYGHRPLTRLKLRPWFEDPYLSELAKGESS
jgi:type IV secretion system protein VirD4